MPVPHHLLPSPHGMECRKEDAMDILVRFAVLSGAPKPEEQLGFEQSTLTGDETMQRAEITLNVWPGMNQANIVGFGETAAHEFGHALGINGHSDDPKDVMFASHR